MHPSLRNAWIAVLGFALGAPVAPAHAGDELVWNERNARHLFNRAGFGGRSHEVAEAVHLGAEGTVEFLLRGSARRDERFPAVSYDGRPAPAEPGDARSIRMATQTAEDLKRQDREQRQEFLAWWVEAMLDGGHPLRERMTLFWHGHFTSSVRDVKSSYEMIRQNQLFREHGLGSFAELLNAVARDPAMLEYLDNDSNRRGHPNENFARELMELFTLGEGNYTEKDIQEVARAFTGWTDREGEFYFDVSYHDFGRKNVLGHRGDRLKGEDVLAILLEEDACGEWIASRLIAYFEGVPPERKRVEDYGRALRKSDYDLTALLRRLFLDPAFYRDEVVGTRVAGPIDYLVGACRRLGLSPPPEAIVAGSGQLGQQLFDPPNVKGWEGGTSWITTSSLMERGNLMGVLLGAVRYQEIVFDDSMMTEEDLGRAPGSDSGARQRMGRSGSLRVLRELSQEGWAPDAHLTTRFARQSPRSERELVGLLASELLAIEPSEDSLGWLATWLEAERTRSELSLEEVLAGGSRGEKLLRRTAHLILCLPEAQLH